MIQDEIEYFYVFKNDLNYNEIHNINKIQLYDECEENEDDLYRHYSNNSEVQEFKSIAPHFLNSEDFESKINNYFKKFAVLKELPQIFFQLKKKNQNNYIYRKYNYNDFDSYLNDCFSNFCEIDGAFLYKRDTPLILFFYENNKFILSKKYTLNDFTGKKEDFIISPYSVLLIEDKISATKYIDLALLKENCLTKEEINSSLIFTVYKLIKKINFYQNYLEKKMKIEDKYFKEYHFHLILSYNNKHISRIEKDFIKCFKFLKNNGYLNNIKDNFDIRFIYTLPSISFNKSTTVNDLKKEIEKINNKFNRIQKYFKENNIDINLDEI